MSQAPSFWGLTPDDVEEQLEKLGFTRSHGRTLYLAAFLKMMRAPWTEPRLPKRLHQIAPKAWDWSDLEIAGELSSGYDKATKLILRTRDDMEIETVVMPEKGRITLCVSSQVGCAQACVFCSTGKMGKIRDLTAAEIVGQYMAASRWIQRHPEFCDNPILNGQDRITNIVFMGMGEPLDNVPGVAAAIRILTHGWGPRISPNRMTVSTAGHLEGLKELVARKVPTNIALSLHSVDDKARSKLMPINRRFPIASVLDWFRDYTKDGKRSVLIQYTVIEGINDTAEAADALLQALAGINAKINLIPLNQTGLKKLKAPDPEALGRFRDRLHAGGARVMVRYSKGQDILAGCGQLRRS